MLAKSNPWYTVFCSNDEKAEHDCWGGIVGTLARTTPDVLPKAGKRLGVTNDLEEKRIPIQILNK